MGAALLTAAAVRAMNGASPLAAALAYAAIGIPVFPLAGVDHATGACTCRAGADCEAPGKHPLVKGWADRATTDSRQVRSWWGDWHPGANIALPTGQRSGLLVVDVDRQHDGPATRDALAVGGHRFPPTLAARTRGGGWHFYYRAPPGVHVANTTSAIAGLGSAPGIDIRGDGGYIIAAPSVRPIDPDPATGAVRLGHYAWTAQDHPLADAPSWVTTPRPAQAPDSAAAPERRRAGSAAVGRPQRRAAAALAAEVQLVAGAVARERNSRLFQAAANLFEICNTGYLDPALVRAELTAAAQGAGLGEAEIRQTLDAQWRRKQGVHRPGWDPAPAARTPSGRAGAAPSPARSSSGPPAGRLGAQGSGDRAHTAPVQRPIALAPARIASGRLGFGR